LEIQMNGDALLILPNVTSDALSGHV
jgi:hypothetical protein